MDTFRVRPPGILAGGRPNRCRRSSPPGNPAPPTNGKQEAPWSRQETYSARLDIDYPEQLDRFSTLLRVFFIIPIAIVLSLVSAAATSTTVVYQSGEVIKRTTSTGGGIAGGLFAATVLMLLFRQRYPRWWFDFVLAFNRFGMRVGAYLALLTDRTPRPRTSSPSTSTWTTRTHERASTGGCRWSSGSWRCPTTSCCCSSGWAPSWPW